LNDNIIGYNFLIDALLFN